MHKRSGFVEATDIARMCKAISILDEARDNVAVAHLQAAIDLAERSALTEPGDEPPDDDADTTELRTDPALICAIVGAFAVMKTDDAPRRSPTQHQHAALHGGVDLLGERSEADATRGWLPTFSIR